MKVKIIIPIYNDWQSVFKLFEGIDNLKIDEDKIEIDKTTYRVIKAQDIVIVL